MSTPSGVFFAIMRPMYDPSKRSQKQIILTDDGSTTLYSAEFDQTYHSTKDGALNESLQKHVIPALILQRGKPHLNILDINYGLGYNTLATLHYIQSHDLDVTVHIVSPEFDEALVRSLRDFDYPPEFDRLQPVIEAIANNLHYEDERFIVDVVIGDARQTISDLPSTLYPLPTDDAKRTFDIIYQDAFSPDVNPLLWTREWFADIRMVSAEDAVLTTYSVAAATRMALFENGFDLYEYRSGTTRKSLIAIRGLTSNDLSRRDESFAGLIPEKLTSNDLSRSDESFEGAMRWIDMALKMERNPQARSLRDIDFMG